MTVLDFVSVINSILPEPHAGLLNGILFGTKATLSPDLMDALVKTSTLHIIALSGMNITILTNLVSITLLRFISRRIASVLTIVTIIGFILFVGPSASVIRAGIMGSLALLAVVFGRQTWSLLFLILASGIMLIVHPAWITDIGFQLSVLATLGIILFGKKLGSASVAQKNFDQLFLSFPRRRESILGVQDDENFLGTAVRLSSSKILSPFASLFVFIWSLIEDDLRVTLAAQVFTIPLILYHFHRVSLISPVTNILIGWIIQPVTIVGLAAAIIGYVFFPLGMLIGWVAWVPLQYMILVIQITSMLPFASLSL